MMTIEDAKAYNPKS